MYMHAGWRRFVAGGGCLTGALCVQARLAKAMFMHVGKNAEAAAEFDLKREYLFQDELYGVAGAPQGPRSCCAGTSCAHDLQECWA